MRLRPPRRPRSRSRAGSWTSRSQRWTSLAAPMGTGLGPLRHGRRRERLLDDAQHRCPLAFRDRDEAAELEPGELDAALGPDELEPEVGEEVAREHGPVDEKALVGRLSFGIAVRERLQRLRALVTRLPDRGEKERLL